MLSHLILRASYGDEHCSHLKDEDTDKKFKSPKVTILVMIRIANTYSVMTIC